MRNKSFGQNGVSFLDSVIFYLRSRKIKNYFYGINCLVDIGCGYDATLLKSIQKKFNIKKCVGIDLQINNSLVTDNFLLQQKDINYDRIDLAGGSADGVVSLAVLEHLDKPEHLVSESFRLLKVGGRLVLTTPSKFSEPILHFLGFFGFIDYTEIKDHKNYFNKNQLRKMMINAGFKDSNVQAKSFLFGLNNFIYCIKD